jgi:alpha-beta hydrolase superfamily lysophospholipase
MASDFLSGDATSAAVAGGLGTLSAADGYTLRYRRYRPASSTRAAVLFLHGIQSHAGWYDGSCRFLAARGFDVFFVDRRGSGMNNQDRGFCTGVGQLCDDVVRCVNHVRMHAKGLPVFLAAISWGAKLAVATLKRRPRLVDGLVLVTPGFAAKIGPTLRERLMIGWSFLLWPRRPIRVPLTDPELFTDNEEWKEFLRQDPRLLRVGTARLLMTSVFLDRQLPSAARRVDVPTVTFLAGRDRIIDNERVRRYVNGFAARDNRVIEYASAHHTLEFEQDPTPYFHDLADWLTEHARAPALPNSRIG